MKDISMKRLIRWTFACLIVYTSIAFIFGVGIASAETGSISVTSSQTINYSFTDVLAAQAIDWSRLWIYNVSYNDPWIFETQIPGGTFDYGTNYTNFNCVSGCTGSGTFKYNASTGNVTYYFYNVIATNKIMNFSFTDPNVPNQTHTAVGNVLWTSDPAGIDANHPMGLYSMYGLLIAYNPYINHKALIGGYTTNTYNVSYQNNNVGQFFTAVVDKTQSALNTKVKIRSNTITYFTDGSFNKTNVQTYNQYLDGIYINVSLVGGESTEVLVNGTGVPGFVPPTPPIVVNPTTGAGIMFDSDSYSIGGTANISWIRTISTPFGYVDDIYLIQPGNIKKILVSSPPNSGYIKTKDFPIAGKYQVTFERSILGLFPVTLASDNATVISVQPSYIIINSTIPSNYPFNFTWLLGYTPALQVITNGIEIYQLSSGWLVSTCYNSNIVANTEYTCTATVPAAGEYKVVLRDIAKGNVVTVFTIAVDAYKPPSKNITVSSLSIDKTAYYRGDDMQITFEIDNTNYSKYMTFYSFWNRTLNKNIANYKLDGKQFGTTDNVLGTYADSWDFKRTLSGTGLYNISLMARNDTTELVITSVNFSYTDANRRGFSLLLKNKTVCTNEAQVFTYILPENVTLRIQESSTGKTVASYNLSESGSLRYTTTKTGVYLVSLQAAGDGTLQVLDDYTVTSNCGTAGAVPTPVSGAGQAQQVASMITTPIFWALMVTTGLMIAIAWKTKDGFASGSVGMLSAGVFAYMSWLPLWIFFSVLIIAALLLSSSLVAKQLKKTG